LVTTADLIERLSADATPVRPLRPPRVRVGAWLVVAALVMALLAVLYGVRPDLAERLRQPSFALALIGALLTGVLAAAAAFHVSLPDRSRAWLLLPLPPLLLWVSTIGYGCLTDWVSIGPAGIELGTTLQCFVTLVVVSVPTSIVLLLMLRHTARLQPSLVAMTGGLASAGLAAVALTLFHEIDASLMVLLWNLGTAVVLVGFAGMFGRSLFTCVSPQQIEG
jgi:hypothetical protein